MGLVKAMIPNTLRWENHYSSMRWMVKVTAPSRAIEGAYYSIYEEGGGLNDSGWTGNKRLVLSYPLWKTDNGVQYAQETRTLPHSVFDFLNLAEELEARLLSAQGVIQLVDSSPDRVNEETQ